MGKLNINDTVLLFGYYIRTFGQNMVQSNYTEITLRAKETMDYMKEKQQKYQQQRNNSHLGHFKQNS